MDGALVGQVALSGLSKQAEQTMGSMAESSILPWFLPLCLLYFLPWLSSMMNRDLGV